MSCMDKQYEKLNKKEKYYSSDMDGTVNGIVPTYLFDDYQLYDFDEYKFMGVKSADEYLQTVFGNYMQLPPIEKRVPHHIDYIDLNMPYRNYIR